MDANSMNADTEGEEAAVTVMRGLSSIEASTLNRFMRLWTRRQQRLMPWPAALDEPQKALGPGDEAVLPPLC